MELVAGSVTSGALHVVTVQRAPWSRAYVCRSASASSLGACSLTSNGVLERAYRTVQVPCRAHSIQYGVGLSGSTRAFSRLRCKYDLP
jgi:hypothetical protein